MKTILTIALAVTLTACGGMQDAHAERVRQIYRPSLPAVSITAPDGRTTISTCVHDAGAICSLVRNGVEYINDTDHGRQLQSAVSYDGKGENDNPTEAGASHLTNGYNPSPSSSRLVESSGAGNVISTFSQMAYWNPVAGQRTSDTYFEKRVQFITPTVIRYDVAYVVPKKQTATFETLTAYMPAAFSEFHTADGARLSDGPGEQEKPVILATPNGQHAMGIYSQRQVGYGRWRFRADGVVKWNAVVRDTNVEGIYRFTLYVVVGTLDSVRADIAKLSQQPL